MKCMPNYNRFKFSFQNLGRLHPGLLQKCWQFPGKPWRLYSLTTRNWHRIDLVLRIFTANRLMSWMKRVNDSFPISAASVEILEMSMINCQLQTSNLVRSPCQPVKKSRFQRVRQVASLQHPATMKTAKPPFWNVMGPTIKTSTPMQHPMMESVRGIGPLLRHETMNPLWKPPWSGIISQWMSTSICWSRDVQGRHRFNAIINCVKKH